MSEFRMSADATRPAIAIVARRMRRLPWRHRCAHLEALIASASLTTARRAQLQALLAQLLGEQSRMRRQSPALHSSVSKPLETQH